MTGSNNKKFDKNKYKHNKHKKYKKYMNKRSQTGHDKYPNISINVQPLITLPSMMPNNIMQPNYYPNPYYHHPYYYQQTHYNIPQQHYQQNQNYNDYNNKNYDNQRNNQYYDNNQNTKNKSNYRKKTPNYKRKKKAFDSLKKEKSCVKTDDMINKKSEETSTIELGFDIIHPGNMKSASTSTNTQFIDRLLQDVFGFKKETTKLKSEAPIIKENNFDLEKEYEKLPFELKSLNDLIKLGKMYDKEKPHQYGINMKRLNYINNSLEKFKNIIGMNNIKDIIFKKIVTYIQGLGKIDDMLNIVIQAPPGYGKTTLGYLLSEIFYKLGIIKQSDNKKSDTYLHPITHEEIDFPFIIAKRKDLIGEYLGQTAPKVEKKIKEAEGGVLFIDEAYSLGSTGDRKESYSETCLNTLNQLLSEKAGSLLCIIAGYKEELQKSFFINPGLERRFRLIFNIEKYTPLELSKIFNKMILDDEWKLSDSIIINKNDNMLIDFLKENKESFKFCGGDMQALLQNCRDAHSIRVIGKHPKLKKIITMEDIKKGYKLFIQNMDRKKDTIIYSMYC